MKEIKLTKGNVALVDDEDYEYLNQYKWYYNGNYAARGIRLNNKCTSIIMHRLIMNNPAGLCVAHINHNHLDNRRENLRICTKKENGRNKSSHIGSSSKYLGVSWRKIDERWGANIGINGNCKYLGTFINEDDAALAYNKAATEYYGEFANLNIIKELNVSNKNKS